MIGHRPADDPPTEGIQNHRKVQEALPSRQVGAVGDPEAIRLVGREHPLDQVLGDGSSLIAPGSVDLVPPADADQPCCAHQPCDSLAPAVDLVGLCELGADPRRAVGATALLMNRPDALDQRCIRLTPNGCPSPPRSAGTGSPGRLLGEEGGRFSQDLLLLAQDPVLPAQPR